MNPRTILLAAAVAGLVTACGDDQPAVPAERAASEGEPAALEAAAALEAVEPIIEREIARQEARDAVHFPCTILGKDEASELLGGEVDAPGYAYEHKNHNRNLFEADACTWSAFGDGPSLYVWVSRPAQFPAGAVGCVTIDDSLPSEEIAGGAGQWIWQKSFDWAQLNVCRDDGLFFVEMHDVIGGEAGARATSIGIAERIAAEL